MRTHMTAQKMLNSGTRRSVVGRRPRTIPGGLGLGLGDLCAVILLCPSCGDHPYLNYSEISSRLQRIRGPYAMEAGPVSVRAGLWADHLRRGLVRSGRR
jgi:hypothetical protein